MRVHSGVVLDFAHSTAEIAGVTFPACFVELPMCEPWDDHEVCQGCLKRGGCFAGGAPYTWDPAWSRGCEFYVPLENGLLINVAIDETPRGQIKDRTAAPQPVEGRNVTLCAHVPWGYPEPVNCPTDTRSYVIDYPKDHFWYWEACDTEWVAEHLQRISRKAYDFTPSPEHRPVKLVPLNHPSLQPKEPV